MKRKIIQKLTYLSVLALMITGCGNAVTATEDTAVSIESESAAAGTAAPAESGATAGDKTQAANPAPSQAPAATPKATATTAPTATPKATATATAVPTPTATPMATATAAPTATPKATATATAVPTPTATATATAVPTPEPTAVPTPEPTPEPEPTPVPEPTPEPVQHTHSWTETGRNEVTTCREGTTTITISYSCSCGETKTDTQTVASNCSWDWIPSEWEYDVTGCEKHRHLSYKCTVHNQSGYEMPRFENVDEHNYVENRIEPSCDTKGGVYVSCSKCSSHFPEKSYVLTNDIYPDGGGNGHDFQETARRPLDDLEKAWFEGKTEDVTYTCTKCGFSYHDVE